MVFNSCKPPEKTQTLPSADYDHAVLKQHNQWQTTYQTLFRILLNSVVPEEFDWQTHIASLDLAWRLGHVGRPVIKPGAWLNLNMPAADHTAQQLAYSALNNYHQGKFQLGWLYWLTALFLMYRQPHANPNQKACILAFLHLAQLFRRDMIHDGVGLKRFVRYFDNPVRKIASEQHRDQDSLHQLLGEENQWAELKITEWIADKSAALRFINTSCTQLGKGKLNINNTELNKFLARTHTCIHFIRIPSQIPHTARRIKALGAAQKIDQFLNSATAAHSLIGEDKTTVLDLTQLIRGLDVAGDELATPTEVFAPAIRWLRREPLRSLGFNHPPHQRLHLSIHAGEDFNHLLGGLRHLDETVQFCEMGQYDRIGHGLALGILPEQWFKCGEVFVTVAEHLDNLVWAWHQAQILSGLWANAEVVALRLVARINIYAPLVYPDYADQLTPEDLYQAWLLRRNCPVKWRQYLATETIPSELKHWLPDVDKAYAQPDSTAYKLNASYQGLDRFGPAQELLQPNQTSIVLIKKGEQLPTACHPLNDWLAPVELDFMEALQDYLLVRYAQKGLIIEANPSSNVFISRIEDYHLHPIFRWYPPHDTWLKPGGKFNRFNLRQGAMPVCVNTDDPGIFPTTLPNEFQLLKEAALHHHGIGTMEAECWLESLRQAGVDIFSQTHTDVIIKKQV
ncbi:hypothetical protein KEF85_07545 [Methylomonas paludis]|uniref:Adenosine deaminase n=1 Tax=Methylomonas paludis TaxID=1173101 RepID=A0A975RAB0_9GAMM|nr:hypothetical protein [Methylomonas paludis]QWF72290.1 hypothetical protein KEF85_07545 [Methylomonas paludis]